jgi:hypothetical protein
MSVIEFLQTRQGQNAVALGTIAIIGIAFIVGFHPFHKKKKSKEPALWMAGDYYTFLRANIQTCITFEELESLKNAVDGFFNKNFRVPIASGDRKRYYTRLMEAIDKRENDLEGSMMAEMCSN